MNKRLDNFLTTAAVIAMLVVVAVIPLSGVAWIYATVDTCGWKGLFVQCRIVDCPK